MSFGLFERELRQALGGPLPGGVAQKRLSPTPRHGWEPDVVPDGARSGAGLLLLYPDGDRPHVVLTVRADDLPLHAGQVSLPGGAVEAGETFEQSALREAHEEVGLEPGDVRTLGRLSPLYIPISHFVLHPVVAASDERPRLRPSCDEVQKILEPPLDALADPSNHAEETRKRGALHYRVPFIRVEGHKLWGATAMIVAELLALVER